MLQRPRHTVGSNEVHVWYLLADRLIDPALLDVLRSLLSADEHERVHRFRMERDRELFRLSRALMRTVLASYIDCPTNEVRFGVNDFGKPILQASGIHFNLTHSRGAVVLAVSNREVGVDVEEHQRQVEYLALAERFFAAPEWRYLQTLPADELPAAFFAIWTLKEAFVKGIGRGLSFPLDAFCFDLEGNRLLRFRPLADFVSPDWHFHQFELSDHHCGAVAVQGGQARIEMRDWLSTFLPLAV
jgi:4'-phosphopantetheinyl transferase